MSAVPLKVPEHGYGTSIAGNHGEGSRMGRSVSALGPFSDFGARSRDVRFASVN
jgi:hypothetical protein